MTSSQEVEIAVLKAKQEDLDRRLEKLEGNQRWGVLGILSLFLKAAFDAMSGGTRL